MNKFIKQTIGKIVAVALVVIALIGMWGLFGFVIALTTAISLIAVDACIRRL